MARALRRPSTPRRGAAPTSRTALLAFAALALGACAGSGPQGGDFQVRGATVVVNSTARFTTSADFPSRVESTLDAALRYWGGGWSDLQGKTVSFDGDQHVLCGGTEGAVGCYQPGHIRVSTRDVATTFNCVEETVLVHEVGHAVIGDPDHTDPRWMDFSPVLAELAGRTGYDDSGRPVDCQLYPNVWRHPPPAP